MSNTYPRLLAAALLGVLLVAGAEAQTVRYVTDQLEITLRSGESTRHQILRMIPSGTAVEVLEENPETGYTRVRLPDKTEGWVLTRYLDASPSARERLAVAQERLKALEAENRSLASEKRTLSNEKAHLQEQLASTQQAQQKLSDELAHIRRVSADVVGVDAENQSLKARTMTLERTVQSLEQQNDVLKDRTARDWFVIGAIVVIVGIGIGLILPRLQVRRRSEW